MGWHCAGVIIPFDCVPLLFLFLRQIVVADTIPQGCLLCRRPVSGLQVVSGESFSGTIASGGEQDVYGVATATSTVSGTQKIFSGGVASGTVVNGGTQEILAGGLASAMNITSGVLKVYGTEIGATLNGGSTEILYSGGVASNTIFVIGSDQTGFQVISSGGLASGTVLQASYNGGNGGNGGNVTQTVLSGGTADGTIIYANGYHAYATELVSSIASGTILSGDSTGSAVQAIASGGLAVSTTVICIDYGIGNQVISSGGVASGTTLSAVARYNLYYGTAEQTVLSGGIAYDTTIIGSGGRGGDGAIQILSSGGVASRTTVEHGGKQVVSAGGSAIDTTVSAGASSSS
jgi:autotransporter passenger strand-loop-strand repeat protein